MFDNTFVCLTLNFVSAPVSIHFPIIGVGTLVPNGFRHLLGVHSWPESVIESASPRSILNLFTYCVPPTPAALSLLLICSLASRLGKKCLYFDKFVSQTMRVSHFVLLVQVCYITFMHFS